MPSERAQAYKMKLEAIKRQAGRPTKEAKENGTQVGHNFDGKKSVEIIVVGSSPDALANLKSIKEATEKQRPLKEES